MPSDNKLELVVEVDVNKANASIKSINFGPSSMEEAARRAGTGAAHGIDGFTTSMAKGVAVGELLVEAIKKVIEFTKEWTIDAARAAAELERQVAMTEAQVIEHLNTLASQDSQRTAIQSHTQAGPVGAEAQLNAAATQIEASRSITFAQAYVQALNQNPKLYQQYLAEKSAPRPA